MSNLLQITDQSLAWEVREEGKEGREGREEFKERREAFGRERGNEVAVGKVENERQRGCGCHSNKKTLESFRCLAADITKQRGRSHVRFIKMEIDTRSGGAAFVTCSYPSASAAPCSPVCVSVGLTSLILTV